MRETVQVRLYTGDEKFIGCFDTSRYAEMLKMLEICKQDGLQIFFNDKMDFEDPYEDKWHIDKDQLHIIQDNIVTDYFVEFNPNQPPTILVYLV